MLQQISPQVDVKSFDEIELTDEETKKALDAEKVKKQIRLEYEAKEERRRLMIEDCYRPWDANEQYKNSRRIANRIVKTHNPDKVYELDDNAKEVFLALSLYFANDVRFEEKGYGELYKGICLTGNVGTGKTLMMYAFSKNKRNCFDIVAANKLTDDYIADGVESLYKYYQTFKGMLGTYEYFLQKEIGLCIDDIGTEPSPIKNFGNTINVLEHVIMERYKNKVPLHLTHFTTNLDGDGIEKKYGSRIRSRLREMVNFIELKGDDRR